MAHALTSEGHDPSEDGTGRGTPLVAHAHNSGVPMSQRIHEGIAPTLASSSSPNRGGSEGPMIAAALYLRGREEGARPELDDVASLRGSSGGSSRSYIADQMVRRLTPTECERLQGLPDGWTAHGPDSRRYAALGDAVTANVAEWIGQRMLSVRPIV